ncbi:9548_t:CDS:2 [Paraglomus occultum]|uniref:9548_t:CDS:1 n=1 Tax=Paraglomus occultum TaxID=144539 RepID=A0A9N9BIC1_9GLOM|nr:9548_t:CDS:2 [Paraglomus occultum]
MSLKFENIQREKVQAWAEKLIPQVHVDNLREKYQAFGRDYPLTKLFLLIFAVFATVPTLCFLFFAALVTVFIFCGAFCIGLTIWLSVIGMAGFALFAALVVAIIATCVVFFWMSLVVVVTKLYKAYAIYACTTCHTHLAKHEDLMSKAFQGRHGRAFLFGSVENISLGPKEDRLLITGLHSVKDIRCNVCAQVVGWKYVFAFEEAQKYKEGKYIVERAMITKENQWDEA